MNAVRFFFTSLKGEKDNKNREDLDGIDNLFLHDLSWLGLVVFSENLQLILSSLKIKRNQKIKSIYLGRIGIRWDETRIERIFIGRLY